ncbi:MAG: hypothetical protein Q8R85_14490 [Bosea sp. (in: a-proteobacteria)]|uniref:hypothetical protein n=1 Tax=Bosea sp. (in: a-proteobacteria) TaxID=1871050 RepID=UPI002733D9CA|nr:hypothetical protein [Bosea sp. (in: a-proteobacteria)]MDP3602364.1 hypothetical protein [Bosea sp. (in: a-proteobacteria)]
MTFVVTAEIRLHALGFEAVELIALARIQRRAARLDRPKTMVKTTLAAVCAVLLPETAA